VRSDLRGAIHAVREYENEQKERRRAFFTKSHVLNALSERVALYRRAKNSSRAERHQKVCLALGTFVEKTSDLAGRAHTRPLLHGQNVENNITLQDTVQVRSKLETWSPLKWPQITKAGSGRVRG
jgi:hypothetical protein